ncbi:MAG: CopG family transcriptional regulator [Streptosporangiales bacterium]|nr:CopG family transcriptional regulator [Streptosporangiales bacterium]
MTVDRDAMESARAETERTRDNALPEDSLSRPNRRHSRVYSVRLSEDEHGAVKELAAEQGIPASTLIRSWIVERLRARSDDSLETRVERLERLVMPRGPAW